jgi:hypothetical protein
MLDRQADRRELPVFRYQGALASRRIDDDRPVGLADPKGVYCGRPFSESVVRLIGQAARQQHKNSTISPRLKNLTELSPRDNILCWQYPRLL